jgi:hypothetical protein
MIGINHRNGKLSLFKKKAKQVNGEHIYRIGDRVYDLLEVRSIGRIEKFIIKYSYIYAVVNGRPIAFDELYHE